MKRAIIVVLLLALVLVGAVIRSNRAYHQRLDPVAAKYAQVQVGMTADDVGRIFGGYGVGPAEKLEESNRKAHKIDADSIQWVKVKIRWSPELIAIYYKDGAVVGKQMHGYAPYPQSVFPTVKRDREPNHAVEPTRAPEGARGSP